MRRVGGSTAFDTQCSVNQGLQTDVRVQAVSESKSSLTTTQIPTIIDILLAMTVIRMIKMFAWERRALDDLDEKREEELKHLLRFKILGMVSGNFKYALLS